MAGNSQRRNRRTSNKKGAQVGSGGQRRRGLEGKGPTPPAEARKGHKKNRIANAKAKQAAAPSRAARRGGGKGTSEMVVGRNPVFEALRDGVPATDALRPAVHRQRRAGPRGAPARRPSAAAST